MALVILAAGCSNNDTEHVARVARVVAAKAQILTGDADGKLSRGWQALCGSVDNPSLEMRVSSRLRLDKSLADIPIEVTASGDEIELKGKLQNLEQRRRAVELAESTTGVEKVVDKLEIPQQDQ